jgi:hypothetical protein
LISVKDYTNQFKWNFLLKISVIQPSIFIEILNVLWTELTGRGYKFLALSMFFNFFYNLSYLAVLIFFYGNALFIIFPITIYIYIKGGIIWSRALSQRLLVELLSSTYLRGWHSSSWPLPIIIVRSLSW